MFGNIRHVINMANSIVGVSILSMPFCFKQTGILLGIFLILLSGFITKKTCMFLIRSAVLARRRSFEFLGFHVFGIKGKLAVELSMIIFLLGICISFHVVIGDLASAVISTHFSFKNTSSLRVTILVGMVLFIILPLCLLRNLDNLVSMSACSLAFYLFLITVIFTYAFPHLLDGSWFKQAELWKPQNVFQVLPITCLGLACQSNVFEIYDSIPEPDITKMRFVVSHAVNLCCGLYITVGFFGYVAFLGQDFGGNIVMSLPNTMLTEGIKIFFVISLALSFPLVMFPCRTSVHSFLYRRNVQGGYDLLGNYMPETKFRSITCAILLISLVIGVLIPNIEFILGFLGSTMGMMIAFILPAFFFVRVNSMLSGEKLLAQSILIFGLTLAVVGSYSSVAQISEVSKLVGQSTGTGDGIVKSLDGYQNPENFKNIEKSVPIVENSVDDDTVRKEPVAPEPPAKVDIKLETDTKDFEKLMQNSLNDNIADRKEPAVLKPNENANIKVESDVKYSNSDDNSLKLKYNNINSNKAIEIDQNLNSIDNNFEANKKTEIAGSEKAVIHIDNRNDLEEPGKILDEKINKDNFEQMKKENNELSGPDQIIMENLDNNFLASQKSDKLISQKQLDEPKHQAENENNKLVLEGKIERKAEVHEVENSEKVVELEKKHEAFLKQMEIQQKEQLQIIEEQKKILKELKEHKEEDLKRKEALDSKEALIYKIVDQPVSGQDSKKIQNSANAFSNNKYSGPGDVADQIIKETVSKTGDATVVKPIMEDIVKSGDNASNRLLVIDTNKLVEKENINKFSIIAPKQNILSIEAVKNVPSVGQNMIEKEKVVQGNNASMLSISSKIGSIDNGAIPSVANHIPQKFSEFSALNNQSSLKMNQPIISMLNKILPVKQNLLPESNILAKPKLSSNMKIIDAETNKISKIEERERRDTSGIVNNGLLNVPSISEIKDPSLGDKLGDIKDVVYDTRHLLWSSRKVRRRKKKRDWDYNEEI